MKTKVLMMALAAGLMMTSCASKKDLVNCQTENKSLSASLMSAKEDLAAKNARIASLEEQQKGMQQALKAAEGDKVRLRFSGAMKVIEMLPLEGESYIFLIMPIQLR